MIHEGSPCTYWNFKVHNEKKCTNLPINLGVAVPFKDNAQIFGLENREGQVNEGRSKCHDREYICFVQGKKNKFVCHYISQANQKDNTTKQNETQMPI